MPYATLPIREFQKFAPFNIKRPVELEKKIAKHIGVKPTEIKCEPALKGQAVKITHRSKQPNVIKEEIRGPSIADLQAQAQATRFVKEDIKKLREENVQPASRSLENGCGTLDGIIQAVKELQTKSNSQDFKDVAEAAEKWESALRGVGHDTVAAQAKPHLDFLKNRVDGELRKIRDKVKTLPDARQDCETLVNELAVARMYSRTFGDKFKEMTLLVTSTRKQINQQYKAKGHGAILT